jgi:hypothetical protein
MGQRWYIAVVRWYVEEENKEENRKEFSIFECTLRLKKLCSTVSAYIWDMEQ